jgi:hypothetical protein
VGPKHRSIGINTEMPAIVLLNPSAGRLFLEEPKTQKQKDKRAFWEERAYVRVIGDLKFRNKILQSERTNFVFALAYNFRAS